MKKYNLQDLEKEVESLDIKKDKDYLRFSDIRKQLREDYKDRLKRGRVAEYDFILEKERKSFNDNYPRQGYEYYKTFREHVEKYYSSEHCKFKNFEQEQYMYDDLALQYKRARLFGGYNQF
jgi:hypothetical protein